MSNKSTRTIEVRYLSQNHTHLQVEHADAFGNTEEYWIPYTAIHSEFNIFDPILEIEVDEAELSHQGIYYA